MKKSEIPGWYDKNVDKYANNFSASFVAKEALNLFAKSVPKKSMILDVGSGLGQDTEYLTEHGHFTIGVDSSREMIKYSLGKRKAGVFVNADFFQISGIFGKHVFGGLWVSSSILTHTKKKDF